MYISIENHNLTAIATDGAPIEPITVDTIGLADGERYDFVLTADQEVGNYWFRVRVAEGFWCRNGLKEDYAILHYEGADEAQPEEPLVGSDDSETILNPAHLNTPNGIDLIDLTSAGKVK